MGQLKARLAGGEAAFLQGERGHNLGCVKPAKGGRGFAMEVLFKKGWARGSFPQGGLEIGGEKGVPIVG